MSHFSSNGSSGLFYDQMTCNEGVKKAVSMHETNRFDPIRLHSLASKGNIDWLQSLKQFFTIVLYHILEACLTLMALF